MAHDSLGKKTHLGCTLHLFWNAGKIWGTASPVDPKEAAQTLRENEGFDRYFSKKKWPRDIRSVQAYVHRFFRWLELKPEEREIYPTVILSAGDSIALRQSLWLDFVFGTPEAERAARGLWEAIGKAAGESIELSGRTHRQFCRWVNIPYRDNTRRGPFARWLEDAGLGFALPSRKGRETAIVVPQARADQVSPEAFTYGLYIEYGKPLDHGSLRPVEVTRAKVGTSLTLRSLMLPMTAIDALLGQAGRLGYVKKTALGIAIDPEQFASALKNMGPLPSQSWVDEESSEDKPLTQEVLKKLKNFPEDDCHATEGSPFDDEKELRTVKRARRDQAFRARVGDAYKHRCCISGLCFRSPAGKSWHGEAIHIIPASGRARDGSVVYGKPVVSNGLFLCEFYHWCLDKGWITLEPVRRGGRLKGYKVKVATVAVDPFFSEEGSILIDLDNQQVPTERLPDNPSYWPSIVALQWHEENVFAG